MLDEPSVGIEPPEGYLPRQMGVPSAPGPLRAVQMRALILAGACWALPQQRVSSLTHPHPERSAHSVLSCPLCGRSLQPVSLCVQESAQDLTQNFSLAALQKTLVQITGLFESLCNLAS